MALLRLENVSKSFGGLRAVDSVSFSVAETTIFGLIGPNGSGKTTVFNLITGMEKADKGQIFFRDVEITRLRPNAIHRQGVTRTFQIVRPFGDMTALENVMVGPAFSANPASVSVARDKAMKFLELVELAEKAHVLARTLTLYEVKKLELARAIASKPALILIDEFFAGLSPPQVAEGVRELKRLNTEFGITLAIIEHNIRALMQLAETITVLHYGKKIAQGTPDEIATTESVIAAYLGGRYAKTLGK